MTFNSYFMFLFKKQGLHKTAPEDNVDWTDGQRD